MHHRVKSEYDIKRKNGLDCNDTSPSDLIGLNNMHNLLRTVRTNNFFIKPILTQITEKRVTFSHKLHLIRSKIISYPEPVA